MIEDRDIFTISDEFINGTQTDFPLFGFLPNENDSVVIQLQSVDQSTYLYFEGLDANDRGGPFAAAPGNPLSNVQGTDVIGYFSAFTVDSKGITIE